MSEKDDVLILAIESSCDETAAGFLWGYSNYTIRRSFMYG